MYNCICGLAKFSAFFCFYCSTVAQWFSGKESTCQRRRCGFDPWFRKIPWRRQWQPTPVVLPGESRGWRSLVGHSPQGRKESAMIERLCFAYSCIISWLLFLFRLLYNIEQSSLCYLSNRSLLVIHFIYSSLYISIPNSLTIRLLPFPPVAISLFSESVNLFLT